MYRGQMLVAIAEVVLAELAGHVTLSHLSNSAMVTSPRLQAFVGTRQPDLDQAGTVARIGQ